MSLKIAISGKGGVGKSTLSGTLARLFAADGRQVLAIDADPDANLASAIGMPMDLRSTLKPISLERDLIQERTGARAQESGQIFSINPDVRGIAEKYAVNHAGVDLLLMGAVLRAGGGCACPESVLLKSLIRYLVLKRDDIVILDMEAGIEHLGRSTATGVDVMIAVVEPGQRSVETAHRIREMSAGIGIKQFAVVINKSTNTDEDKSWIVDEFGVDAIIGVLPFSSKFGTADRSGKSIIDLGDDNLIEPFKQIKSVIENRFETR